ncbi:DUF2997 domain-containing protein [Methanoregula formicica]|uniref:DUF2997 domain-containing protein n=1 Tax=Methanoregula formicica (strain DSM 22288 / NBRC 105244 / SMSP) TaxID=593750 RepID=L0HIE3_METFS|nr:DUF2997 domain-containing protein [Methanoregula formicica]AGB03551.1 Protein of unknown function (DUF2997) [Methanoregula formicica SMSP]
MELQEMEINIDKEGRVQINVKGVQGTGCLALTRDLETALGVVEQREYSADYYQQETGVCEHRTLKSR